MTGRLMRHLQSALFATGRLARAPVATGFTVLVIAIVAVIAVMVAAAGNTGGRVDYPGASDGVIGVSATDSDDKLAKFSSRGNGVDLAAPGVNIVQQTICNRGRDKCERFPGYNGTSMASPHVAGVAAVYLATNPGASPSAVTTAVLARTTKDAVPDARSSANDLLFTDL